MSRRDPNAEQHVTAGRERIAPLASVTLARLYLEQRQLERARAMLHAVLTRNPLDLAARVLSRRIGPTPPRLTLTADDSHWIVRGVVAQSLARTERLEIVLVAFRARTITAPQSRGEAQHDTTSAIEPEWATRAVTFVSPPQTGARTQADLASSDTTTFEVRFERPRGVTQASVVACLRRAPAAVKAKAASDATDAARIFAVTPVQHV